MFGEPKLKTFDAQKWTPPQKNKSERCGPKVVRMLFFGRGASEEADPAEVSEHART